MRAVYMYRELNRSVAGASFNTRRIARAKEKM